MSNSKTDFNANHVNTMAGVVKVQVREIPVVFSLDYYGLLTSCLGFDASLKSRKRRAPSFHFLILVLLRLTFIQMLD